ncbi:MAG: hypothetical protein ACK4GQ_00080 [Candidatus Hadarchaeales archaeon]
MERRGTSSIFDLLLLAIIVSAAMVLLTSLNPTAGKVDEDSYVAACSRGVAAGLLGAAAKDFEYSPGMGGFQLPVFSSPRKLGFTPLADLLAEGFSLSFKGNFDVELERHLREFLDNTLGRRFAYRLHAGMGGGVRVVENLSGRGRILWVKETTLLAPFPEEGGEIQWLPVEVKLEVWSR